MIHLLAPAKINLAFEIAGTYPSGFHEVHTVLQSINIFDELIFNESKDLTLSIESSTFINEENLVLKAANMLKDTYEVSEGASINLVKNIPISAGLGGGSSDAAFTLLGLNKLWRLGLDTEELIKIAGRIGTDVPFFITGGTSYATGTGTQLSPLPQPVEKRAVLIFPFEPLQERKTARMYRQITKENFTDGEKTQNISDAIIARRPIASEIFNIFDSVATLTYSSYAKTKSMLDGIGQNHSILAGSGPSMFTLLNAHGASHSMIDLDETIEGQAFYVELISSWPLDGMHDNLID